MSTGIFGNKNNRNRARIGWTMMLLAGLALGGCSKSSSGPVEGVPAGAGGAKASSGAALFQQYCQRCHGPNAAGSNFGPPLVHKIYEPGHHPDVAFYRAAQGGVRAHHWQFGNMPPIAGVSHDEVTRIIAYIRGLQRQAGIH